MKNKKIAIIGSGNMGSAIIGGILESGLYQPDEIMAADVDASRLEALRSRYGIGIAQDGPSAASAADLILLAVKPQTLPEVASVLKSALGHAPLLISILAGVPISKIQAALGENLPVVRVMPNLPARVRMGASGLAVGPGVSREQTEAARAVFESVGAVVEVEEDLIDAVTALSGSGPGFVYRLMEAFEAAGRSLGLEETVARTLTAYTFLGAAKLLVEEDAQASTLREQVTSRGGTTFAGLTAMNEKGIDELIRAVLEAAHNRAQELGRG